MFAILLTISISVDSSVLLGFLVALLVIFVYIEISDFIIMKSKKYFTNYYNYVDVARIGLSAAYLHISHSENNVDKEDLNTVRTLAVVIAWI